MNDKQARWLALYVLCLGDLMIVLDTNIVNVALPSIQADLGFSQTALAWVVNAYMLTFGGFLLLSGRLGDLFGNKRVFLGASYHSAQPASHAASPRALSFLSSAAPCRGWAAPRCPQSHSP
jgi:MFS family permease